MLKKALLTSLVAAQFEDIEDGEPCFGYDTCQSGCCLRNIEPAFDYFYPDVYDPPKQYTDAEITAVEAEQSNLFITGTSTDKDGIKHFTSADGTTYVDVPEYWLNYKPQFSKDVTDDTKKVVNYLSVVCQSNVTMCEGVADPYDFSNIGDLDDALAAATAIGGAVVAVAVILPLMFCIIVAVCCCKFNKLMCFKEQEV